jgi:hypothetical protein
MRISNRGKKSAPSRTRTCDLRFRKPSLYPAEPWAPNFLKMYYIRKHQKGYNLLTVMQIHRARTRTLSGI